MTTYSLKIVDIRRETDDTVTICFKQPAIRKVKYKAGQYLTLMLRINGRRYIRPYSFSSSPVLDSLLEVTIKRVQNGVVSNHIHDQVRIGDIIEVMEPMGDFIYKTSKSIDAMYFWGTGSGITPLISLIKETLFLNPSTQVNLIYGNRNFESTIFFDQIDSLLNRYPERFNVWHFHTQLTIRHDNPYIIEGRINKKFALNILKGINGSNTVHYICGPAGLKESVNEALSTLNVFPENIFTEDFELIKDPKDFEEILTQKIKLSYQSIEYDLEIIKGKSILESALEAGLELPYSCQTGNCSTCKAKCLTGEIKMIGLTKARTDLHEDEYLLCCSHPLTNNVNIQV